MRTIASWMDKKYVDPLLGLLLPGVGDAAGAVIGLYAVYLAWQAGAPHRLVVRMLMNLGFDAFVGTIPVVGWAADFFFKAHVRNMKLLDEHLETEAASKDQSDQVHSERVRAGTTRQSVSAVVPRPSGREKKWLLLVVAVFVLALFAIVSLGVAATVWLVGLL